MIQADRAPVQPRVISPETGDAIPLEDILLDAMRRPKAIVEIVGGHGSGKTAAVAHLAAIVPQSREVVYLDDGSYHSEATAVCCGVAVYTALKPFRLQGAESYRLAPWGDDEILEYMLATHAERCGSVLARLKAAPDRYLPRGLPELWRVVLERMAADESLTNVNAALRQELHRGLPEDGQRAAAEKYCLAELLELTDQARINFSRLSELQAQSNVLRLLRHEAVRLMLATDCLARFLESENGEEAVGHRLPRELVQAVAAATTSDGIENLLGWTTGPNKISHPMAASILHAAVPGWRPERIAGSSPNDSELPWLTGAYLQGARWHSVDLIAASLDQCDLSASDLTDRE